MDTRKVWFVTGASKGLGLHLVKKLLHNGYRVAATSRNAQSLNNDIGEVDEKFLPLEVNLTDDQDVKRAIQQTVAHFGGIDVVVNNAKKRSGIHLLRSAINYYLLKKSVDNIIFKILRSIENL